MNSIKVCIVMMLAITGGAAGLSGCSQSGVSSELSERYSGVYDVYRSSHFRPVIKGTRKGIFIVDVEEKTIGIDIRSAREGLTTEQFDRVVEYKDGNGRQGIAFVSDDETKGIVTFQYYAKEDLVKTDREHGDTSDFEDYEKVARVAGALLGAHKYTLRKDSTIEEYESKK